MAFWWQLGLATRVTIIGGGFSGLAAAVSLSEQGFDVLVLERRPFLGGRAYSFVDSITGDTVDNGQHLFMACYHNTIQFLNKIHSNNGLRFQDSLKVEFLEAGGRVSRFECPALPAPLNVIAGLARYDSLTLWSKLAAIRAGLALRWTLKDQKNETVSEWLDRLRQPEELRLRFWHPFATATLNERPQNASATMLKAVMNAAFTGSARGAAIGVSRVGLSDLYAGPGRSFIEERSGRVCTRANVRRLIIEGSRVAAIELNTGDRIEADYYISAVPHHAFLKLLPASLRHGEFANLTSLGSSPIISINLWFDRPIVESQFLGLLGANLQWLFNKDRIVTPGAHSNQIALVISAAYGEIDKSSSELVEMALADLHRLLPESRQARLIHKRVIKERDATLSHTVESDHLRPGPRTSLTNLVLAGDWTNTGLPATIESAVLSGHVAARIISSDLA